jgi:hypothetical protein
MDNLEKLSKEEFDKIYGEYSNSADKSSEFYINIEKNVKDIRSINIEETTRESLYAQVITSIYFHKDLQNMNGINKFFESLENLFLGISNFAKTMSETNKEIRQDLYKTQWYQGETVEKLKETNKEIEKIVEQNKQIKEINKDTLKNLEKFKKDQEGRNRIYDN